MPPVHLLKAQRAAKLLEAKAVLDANPETLTEALTAQVQTLRAEAVELQSQIVAAEKAAKLRADISADFDELEDAPAPRAARSQPVATVRDNVQDDPKRGFKSPREFMKAVMVQGQRGKMDQRLGGLVIGAAAGSDENSGASDPYGGFLIPEGFRPDLLKVQSEGDPTATLTTKIPMESPVVNIPARTDKNHTTSVSGGLRFHRRAETQTADSSRIQMENVKLEATSLMGKSYATEELLMDSPISFIALLEQGFRDELPAKILDEKIRGTGVGQYLGVLNSAAKIAVAKESGQAGVTIVGQNVLKMRSRCYGYGRSIWLANIDTYAQMAGLHIAGTNGDVFLFNPSRGEDVPDMLLGRPVFFTEFAETTGTEGDLILADWSQYLEGEREGMQMAESIHVRFDNNERAFRVTLRNDGRPWWNAALTPKKGANTLSPIVTLAVRA